MAKGGELPGADFVERDSVFCGKEKFVGGGLVMDVGCLIDVIDGGTVADGLIGGGPAVIGTGWP